MSHRRTQGQIALEFKPTSILQESLKRQMAEETIPMTVLDPRSEQPSAVRGNSPSQQILPIPDPSSANTTAHQAGEMSSLNTPAHSTANQANEVFTSDTATANTANRGVVSSSVLFQGWDSYPKNILDYDVMQYNISEHHRQFNRELVGENGGLGRLVGNTIRVTALTIPHPNLGSPVPTMPDSSAPKSDSPAPIVPHSHAASSSGSSI